MAKSTAAKARRRANGEGSIFEYRGGWRAAITYTDADGIRRRRTVTGKSHPSSMRSGATS